MSELYEAILRGDVKVAVEATRQALDSGAGALELVNREMVPAMDEVGRRYECEDYFVPELLLTARAMKGSLQLLRPLLAARSW
jgi:5-methyltetrahydrofolate--homocysteine methyltransferase